MKRTKILQSMERAKWPGRQHVRKKEQKMQGLVGFCRTFPVKAKLGTACLSNGSFVFTALREKFLRFLLTTVASRQAKLPRFRAPCTGS
jgi:hypothetical protein